MLLEIVQLNAIIQSVVRKLTAPDSLMSGDHSEVVPLLPIPNRTVKHLSADDSADCPCESRSLPDFPKEEPDSKESGFLLSDGNRLEQTGLVLLYS